MMQWDQTMSITPNRRQFLGSAAAFTILPRHVLAGSGMVAPSDKVTVAYIGVGTQGMRELLDMLAIPEIQVISVCDPNKNATGYRDWSAMGLLNDIRRTLGQPDWRQGSEGTIPAGLDVGRDVVDTYYAKQRGADHFDGCSAYSDFRELLEKEKDLNAVKVMTPDHLHGVIAMAAMKRKKHVVTHKPLANRLHEARLVIETARQTGVATHFIPYDYNGSMQQVMEWIRGGAIGKLREVHNWTNRPVWPQYPMLPTDRPPAPEGFNWDLWLGPEQDRPYHPNYTHMVFRGWYDFGGGSMADMGHYSLWTVFNALELSSPTSIEPMLSHVCAFRDNVATKVKNDYSYPDAGAVRFKYPAHGERPAVDLVWWEGGMRPTTPEELIAVDEELPAEGMMFVGDKGKILSGFHVDAPRLLSVQPKPAPKVERPEVEAKEASPGMKQWIAACKGGSPSPGNFLNAWPLSEAANLYGVAMRTGKRLQYDAAKMAITNIPQANQYLAREYRKGWAPETI